MLRNQTVVVIADNTGAKKAEIIRIIKGSNEKFAKIGDKVVVAIKEANSTSSIKKGDVSWGIIVRTKKETQRTDGTYVRFSDNAIILMTKDAKGILNPVGKRIFGPVAKELKQMGYKNITNMAEEVV
ncbi:MAG: 50S ribosomal protein L14 [Candidatus Absconditabacterales bacterium]